jgi:hypothetical protein
LEKSAGIEQESAGELAERSFFTDSCWSKIHNRLKTLVYLGVQFCCIESKEAFALSKRKQGLTSSAGDNIVSQLNLFGETMESRIIAPTEWGHNYFTLSKLLLNYSFSFPLLIVGENMANLFSCVLCKTKVDCTIQV